MGKNVSNFKREKRIMHPYKKGSVCIDWNGLNRKILICIPIILISSVLYSQEREWVLDVIEREEQEKQKEMDSLMIHLKNNWEISLSYGQWYFSNNSKSTEDELFFLSQSMGLWNLSIARYFSESIRANINVGLQMEKFEPEQINFSSILSGGNIEVEGGAVLYIPLSIGLDYLFLKERFRPYAGLRVGNVIARSKYITGSGNITTGIDQDEFEFSGNAPFYTVKSGFIYRTGKHVQLGLNIDYAISRSFEEKVGGYSRYHGFIVAGSFSIVF
jgi:hypothetical protein